MASKPLPEFVSCPFTVIIDTREQSPFGFQNLQQQKRYGGGTLIIRTERKALPTGDYSIRGMEDKIAVERKEMGDFFHCCGSDRERFERQLARLNEMEFGCMMIEADWNTIMRGHRESKMDPESIRGSVIAWQMEYFPKVTWWFGGRNFCELTTFRILDRWWRKNEV
jgi:ERCC4-type nuclease